MEDKTFKGDPKKLDDLVEYIQSIWYDRIDSKDRKVYAKAEIRATIGGGWHYYSIGPMMHTGRAGFIMMYNQMPDVMSFYKFFINDVPISRKDFLNRLGYFVKDNGEIQERNIQLSYPVNPNEMIKDEEE